MRYDLAPASQQVQHKNPGGKVLIHILFTETAVEERMLNVHSSFISFVLIYSDSVFPFSFDYFINLELMMNMQFALQRHWNPCKKTDLDVVHSALWPPPCLLISQAFEGTSTILDIAFAYSSLFFPDKCDYLSLWEKHCTCVTTVKGCWILFALNSGLKGFGVFLCGFLICVLVFCYTQPGVEICQCLTRSHQSPEEQDWQFLGKWPGYNSGNHDWSCEVWRELPYHCMVFC